MMRYFVLIISLACITVACTNKQAGLYNQHASVKASDSLDFNPLQGTVICTGINAEQHTMFTLYGNEMAVLHCKMVNNSRYPAGAILSLVTWEQKPDERWFGANIPDHIQSVEILRFDSVPGKGSLPVYNYYSGRPLKINLHPPDEKERILAISSEKMSVTP